MSDDIVERVARALALYQFGTAYSWEDQTDMARAAIAAIETAGFVIVPRAANMVGSLTGVLPNQNVTISSDCNNEEISI